MKRLLLAFLLFFSLPVWSRADADQELRLDELIEEAKANNPELQAIKADYEAIRATTSWARHLADPTINNIWSILGVYHSINTKIRISWPTIIQHG